MESMPVSQVCVASNVSSPGLRQVGGAKGAVRWHIIPCEVKIVGAKVIGLVQAGCIRRGDGVGR